MTKKKSSEILAVKKWKFFPKKRHSEILVREKVFRPPKLGARSPPLQNPLYKYETEKFLAMSTLFL